MPPIELPDPRPTSTRGGNWIDWLLLACGFAVSGCSIRLVLASGRIHWRLDLDLAVTISLLLASLGPTLLGTPRLVWRKHVRTWTIGEWLWPGAFVTSLAWLIVWLEDGSRLGAVAKLIAGPTALLLTPALGLSALVDLAYSLTRASRYAWTHWLGLLWALLGAAGCVGFIRIMLPLRF
jgi:hypothetical protein